MANTWFKFKEFAINQDKAAMKVGTDGVLLGAWANVTECEKILDVGTGTGLLALMAAQRNHIANITAIDIDKAAIDQSSDNFEASIWSSRLIALLSSLQDFVLKTTESFDYVICNPPFFSNSLKSKNTSRNSARHDDSLSFDDLLSGVYNITTTYGRLAVVIPYQAEDEFINIATNKGFNVSRLMHVRPTPNKGYVRSLIELSKKEVESIDYTKLIVEQSGRHSYSDDYVSLTKEFYLAF